MAEQERPAWDDYRRRRQLFWVAFIGYLPVVTTVGLFLNWIVGSERPGTILALVSMAFFGYAVIRVNSFPCPRCGKPFFYRSFAQNPLAQRCMRCGWPKWVERDEAITDAITQRANALTGDR